MFDWMRAGRIAVAVIMLTLPALAQRQEKDGQVRMVGQCYTPEQASAVLDRLGKTHHDRAGWETRADTIRKGILKGAGLAPLPEDRGPMQVLRHGKKTMDGYTVENIAIETLEGFWLCGNLYLPEGYDQDDAQAAAKRPGLAGYPGVLCPHGHKENKRFTDQVQARCAAFARMGCVAFAYDMVGYTETNQIEHRTPQAFRLQTWNSIRALDFLTSLPRVDTDRLAVTGGSGGGTQSFMLAALDPRIDLSIPVVMVSAYFFGGCVCESGMPVHVHGDFETNNLEIALSFAPKPLLLISNGKDWTRHNPTLEMPYARRVYGYYDAQDQLENAHLQDEGHDYGPSKRAAAYRFIAKHFELDLSPVLNDKGQVDEAWYRELSADELRVFDNEHPRPADAVNDPAKLVKRLDGIIAAKE